MSRRRGAIEDTKRLEDGRTLDLYPLLFGRTRLLVTLPEDDEAGLFADDAWEFPSYEVGKAALDAWDGTGEPEGWDRHPATDRRRF